MKRAPQSILGISRLGVASSGVLFVVMVIAVALSLAVGGHIGWRQALGGLLPGWPWW